MPRPTRESPINRRQFLGSSAANAAVAAGMVGLAGAVAQASSGERLNIGCIGVRGYGRELATAFAGLPDAEVSVLCDIDEGVFAPAARNVAEIQGRAPRFEKDFRRLLDDPTLDAVVIATPDHWHALMTTLACEAGKDVYIESPVSHTLDEGEAMLAAARKSKRVVQCGLQQRSGTHFRSAVEFLASGRLGHVALAKAWTVHVRKPIGAKKDAPLPPGVDYDLWLGPAASRPFNPNRFHYNWHWFWDYGSGELGNWGVQMLDVARWGMGVDWPTRVSATGGKYHFHDDQETPDTLLVNFAYPDRSIVWEHRLWSNHGIEGRSNGVAFYGELGTLILDRGGWKVYGQKETASSGSSELLSAHCRDFVAAAKSRGTPRAELADGCISSGLCHLGNVAYRLERSVAFDPASRAVIGDEAAGALLTASYREPWQPPVV